MCHRWSLCNLSAYFRIKLTIIQITFFVSCSNITSIILMTNWYVFLILLCMIYAKVCQHNINYYYFFKLVYFINAVIFIISKFIQKNLIVLKIKKIFEECLSFEYWQKDNIFTNSIMTMNFIETYEWFVIPYG